LQQATLNEAVERSDWISVETGLDLAEQLSIDILSHHHRRLDGALRWLGEGVDPGRHHSVQGVGDASSRATKRDLHLRRPSHLLRALAEGACHLFHEERISSSPRRGELAQRIGLLDARQDRARQGSGLRLGERAQVDSLRRCLRAPVGIPLRASGGDDHQGASRRLRDERADQGTRRRVEPLHVLQVHDQRPAGAGLLERASDRVHWVEWLGVLSRLSPLEVLDQPIDLCCAREIRRPAPQELEKGEVGPLRLGFATADLEGENPHRLSSEILENQA
jgi:hypothetical protein